MKNIQIFNARWNPYVYLVISDYSLLRTTTPVLEHDICLIRHRLVRKSGDTNCHTLLCDVTTHAASLLSLTLSSAPWQHIPFYFVFIHLETSLFLQDQSSSFTLTKYSSDRKRLDVLLWAQLLLVCSKLWNVALWNVKMQGISGLLFYVQENGSWKPWSLLAKLTHLVGIRESTN